MAENEITRRTVLGMVAGATAGMVLPVGRSAVAAEEVFKLRYIVASCMYGTLPLAEILPEVRKTGADEIDIWPATHGNQREQVAAMGLEKFATMLAEHKVRCGMITRYDLGCYKLQDEMKVLNSLGGDLMVAGSGNVEGPNLKARVAKFVEQLKPHIEVAEEQGVTIAIENHGNQLLWEPDSLRYLAELSPSDRLGIAYAPYHLPQDAALQAQLIKDLGPKLVHFYAWEHGFGCHKAMPKALEMQQLPGYGQLDFKPMFDALASFNYAGRTSIFMHPTPRGIPILPTAGEVTVAMNRSREYVESLL